MSERPYCCGKPMQTPEEAGINPNRVFSDDGWAWLGKDVKFVCPICGAHMLKEEVRKDEGRCGD